MEQDLINDYSDHFVSSSQVEKSNERIAGECSYFYNNTHRKFSFQRQSLGTSINYQINSTNPSSVSSASSSSTSSLSSPNSFQININNSDSTTKTLDYTNNSVQTPTYSSMLNNHDFSCNIKFERDASNQIFSSIDCKNFETHNSNNDDTSLKQIKALDYVNNNSSTLLFDFYECKSKIFL